MLHNASFLDWGGNLIHKQSNPSVVGAIFLCNRNSSTISARNVDIKYVLLRPRTHSQNLTPLFCERQPQDSYSQIWENHVTR